MGHEHHLDRLVRASRRPLRLHCHALTWAEDGKTTDTSLDEIVAAKPEYIFQNHVHLDQMKHASDIAARSGAKLVGSMHCEFAKRNAMTKGLDADKVQCDVVRDSKGQPFRAVDSFLYWGEQPSALGFTRFGEMGRPDEMTPELDVTVVNIKHSASSIPPWWPLGAAAADGAELIASSRGPVSDS